MKIVIDDKIPFIRGFFEPFAEVLYLPGVAIRHEQVRDADCLLVRTRTLCNQQLLEGTKVKFIGTATIGFDHIDTKWCEEYGIVWTNAPGCNSGSVAQYITAALHEMGNRQGFNLKEKTLGVIGVGNVGKKVEKIARELGMKVILNDPPRERIEGPSAFTGLFDLLKNSDIITIHVPLNREGRDKTIDLVDQQFLEALKPGAILINSSRGEVVNEAIVIRWMKEWLQSSEASPVTRHLSLVLDVWQNEPDIDRELLGMADIATPHIAGYSADGKLNATRMIVNSVVKFFGLGTDEFHTTLDDITFIADQNLVPGLLLRDYIIAAYDIMADDRHLRDSPGTFEELRNRYPIRREYNAFIIDPFPTGEIGRILSCLGFKRNYIV